MLKRGYITRHTETDRYLVEVPHTAWHSVTITRKVDGASVHLQGDEAADFLGDIESLWAAYPTAGKEVVEQRLNWTLSQYDDVMEAQ